MTDSSHHVGLAGRTAVALFGVGNVSEQSPVLLCVDAAMRSSVTRAWHIWWPLFDAAGVTMRRISRTTLAVNLGVLRLTRLRWPWPDARKIGAILATLARRNVDHGWATRTCWKT